MQRLILWLSFVATTTCALHGDMLGSMIPSAKILRVSIAIKLLSLLQYRLDWSSLDDNQLSNVQKDSAAREFSKALTHTTLKLVYYRQNGSLTLVLLHEILANTPFVNSPCKADKQTLAYLRS